MEIADQQTRVNMRAEQLREAVHRYGNFSVEAADAGEMLADARRDLEVAIREARTKPNNKRR